METYIRPLAMAAFALVLIGCTGTGGPTASEVDEISTSVIETNDGAPTTEPYDESSDGTDAPVTLPADDGGDTTIEPGETTTTTARELGTTSVAVETTEPSSQVIEENEFGAFTSPSGNIACVMAAETGVSCYISEKEWTIDQPDDPFCAESDWGNAVNVTADGVHFPCYTDFYWNPNADALAYGDRMEAGSFSCISRESGVTCDNGSDGFEVARAEVRMLTF